jgi:hypothetical protein
LPHNNAETASRAFVAGFQAAATCLVHGKVEIARRTLKGELRCYAVLNRQRPTRLSCDFPIWFLATSVFHPAQLEASGAWTVVPKAYYYAFWLSEEGKRELLAFHWHPEDEGAFTAPHLHVGSGGLGIDPLFSPRWHVPTGLIALEDVVRFAISQLGVKPLKSDWQTALDLLGAENMAL